MSDDEDVKYIPDTSDEDDTEEESTPSHVLPPLSMDKYKRVYADFMKFKGSIPVSESVLLKYFVSRSKTSKPTSLWAYYSMLNATLKSKDNINISPWTKLNDYLKKNSSGYIPLKASAFTEEQIKTFLVEARDENYLDIKVVCIFGIHGAYGANRLIRINIEHVKSYIDMILVQVPKTDNTPMISFTITDSTFFNIVKKYVALRPEKVTAGRFFLNYREGKCTSQHIGKNKFSIMARRMAKYLKLPQSERYTALSFRISSIHNSTNTHANINFINSTNPTNSNLVNSTNSTTSTNFVNLYNSTISTNFVNSTNSTNSTNFMNSTNSTILADVIEQRPQLNYRPAQLTTIYTTPSVPAVSNNVDNIGSNGVNVNYNREHSCNIKCGQVKCALEENVESALHAFSLMKPPDYSILELSPAVFGSDPSCRWIVSYIHITDPVSTYNADEVFKEITRSIPNNVTVNQKFVRVKSSQMFAAYVVIYGVNCRCQEETMDNLNSFEYIVNNLKTEL